ncbi:hypothetical protein Clacol_004003 [Clathrus columnatus]|uniref:protein-tyrosine-phosphatase n=1 Tax=Clathrus columnatus TaxID=1419009 RepID=A0AAV5A584_9AGAM|nr:hypothetical protein Clacol_004003 [Clathrus columnatus]
MSSTAYSQNAGTSDENLIQDLAQAISKLSTTTPNRKPTSQNCVDPTRLWKSQIDRYLPLYPNAGKILSKVKIPSELTDRTRLQQFISSTSITPEGQPFPPQITEIFNRKLWFADQYSGTDKGELVRLGITHILCLGREGYHDKLCPSIPFIEHAVLRVPAAENLYDVPLVGIIDNGVSFVRSVLALGSEHKILIHCKRGDTWSPSIVIGVLMDRDGCSFDAAYCFVRARRRNVLLHEMVVKGVQQWWTLEKLRPELPEGRGYRRFKWAVDKEEQ